MSKSCGPVVNPSVSPVTGLPECDLNKLNENFEIILIDSTTGNACRAKLKDVAPLTQQVTNLINNVQELDDCPAGPTDPEPEDCE